MKMEQLLIRHTLLFNNHLAYKFQFNLLHPYLNVEHKLYQLGVVFINWSLQDTKELIRKMFSQLNISLLIQFKLQ